LSLSCSQGYLSTFFINSKKTKKQDDVVTEPSKVLQNYRTVSYRFQNQLLLKESDWTKKQTYAGVAINTCEW
jgi:hypothetical protein